MVEKTNFFQKAIKFAVIGVAKRYPNEVNAVYAALRNNPEVIVFIPAITFFLSAKKSVRSLAQGDIKNIFIGGVSAVISLKSLMDGLEKLETLNKMKNATPSKLSPEEMEMLKQRILEAIERARKEGREI